MSGPSSTAQAVAAWRAERERPLSPEGDPDAQRRLCRGMPPARQQELHSHMAARTRFGSARRRRTRRCPPLPLPVREGLLVYLDEPTTVRVLASLATAAA